MDDLRGLGDFYRGGRSFTFRVVDALELHGPDRGKKGNLSVSKIGRNLDSVRLEKEGEGRVGNLVQD